MHLQHRRSTASWAALGKALPAGQGRGFFSTHASGVLGSLLGPPFKRDTGNNGERPVKHYQISQGTGAPSIQGREAERYGTV